MGYTLGSQGILMENGRDKRCPFSNLTQEKPFGRPCGTWCALFAIQELNDGQAVVLHCSTARYVLQEFKTKEIQ